MKIILNYLSGQCNHKGPLRGKEDGQSQRRCDVLGRGWKDVSISQGMGATSRSWKRQGSDSTPTQNLQKEDSPVPFVPDSPPEL